MIRRHHIALAGIVAGHLALVAFVKFPSGDPFDGIAFGIVFGQLSLIGLWWAWGPGPWLRRTLTAMCLTLALLGALSFQVDNSAVEMGYVMANMTIASALCQALARWYWGMHLRSPGDSDGPQVNQFSLRDLWLDLTHSCIVVAIPTTLFRGRWDELPSSLLQITAVSLPLDLVFFASVAASFAPVHLLALASGWRWVRNVAILLPLYAVLLAVLAHGLNHGPFHPIDVGKLLQLSGALLVSFAPIAGTLGLMQMIGFTLHRRRVSTPPPPSPSDFDASPPIVSHSPWNVH